MRKSVIFGSAIAILLMVGVGCSTNDDYCCTSNDQCLTTSEGLHSCSMATCGKCVAVKPLTITVTNWKDPNVGQISYSVELDVSGGISPYTWGDFTIVNDTGGKLNWLTFKTDTNDSSKAYLTNRVENNVVLVPSQPTEDNEALSIKVTVMDYTKHGKDPTRLDDVGYTFEHLIAINECPQTCINDDGCCPTGCTILTDSDCPVTCGDGVVSAGETCDTGIAAGQAGACPTSCDDANSCTIDTLQNAGTCQAACLNTPITECKENDGCCLPICNHNIDNDCSSTCGNGAIEAGETCDPPSSCPTSCDDGNPCTDDSMTGSASNCNVVCSHSNKIDGFDCGNNQRCLSGICTSCSGCWVGSQCQPGTDVNICGAGGVNCFACQDIADSKCLPTGCSNGQCTYRYTIQNNNGAEEVFDTLTNLYWKRQIEPDIYVEMAALLQCMKQSYQVPDITQLTSIVETGHGSPTINLCSFPNTPATSFWSSSDWYMNFANGVSGQASITSVYYSVRCIRD